MKECPRCGRKLIDEVEECPTCGFAFFSEKDKSSGLSSKPTIAGIMMMISASMGIVLSILILSGFWDIQSMLEISQSVGDVQGQENLFSTILNVCSVVLLCIGAVEFIGGFYAIKRKNWVVALIGALAGIFIIGFFFLSSILSVIALIMILIAKDEFSDIKS